MNDTEPDATTTLTVEDVAERLASIRRRIASAAARSGRDPGRVSVIGVTKTQPLSTVRTVLAVGLLDIGENYAQELLAKNQELASTSLASLMPRWHMIGHLQRNKASLVVPFAAMIQSVDSERLAREIDRQAQRSTRRMPILLQVNTSGEASKFGVDPEGAIPLAERIERLPNLDLAGLMTIAAPLDNVEELRPMFRQLREIRDALSEILARHLEHLSMGMTDDFEVAVEEGSTMIRVGSGLFGRRPSQYS